MNIPERHDREVFAHQQRQDAAERRRHELRAEAANNIADRFWNDPSYFGEVMKDYGPDELIGLIGRNPADFWLARKDAFVAQSLLCSLINGVFAAHEERAVEREIDRLDT